MLPTSLVCFYFKSTLVNYLILIAIDQLIVGYKAFLHFLYDAQNIITEFHVGTASRPWSNIKNLDR